MAKKKKAKKVRKKKDILFDDAWKYFTNYIKRRDKYICITCGNPANQGGHFIHGKTKSVYFDEYNVHAQCKKCNFFLDGNRDIYLREIQKRYGIEKGDELLKHRYEGVKFWRNEELEAIRDKYMKKLIEGSEYKF